MTDDTMNKLTAYYMLGSTARKQQETREEIRKKIVENMRSMSGDEMEHIGFLLILKNKGEDRKNREGK